MMKFPELYQHLYIDLTIVNNSFECSSYKRTYKQGELLNITCKLYFNGKKTFQSQWLNGSEMIKFNQHAIKTRINHFNNYHRSSLIVSLTNELNNTSFTCTALNKTIIWKS